MSCLVIWPHPPPPTPSHVEELHPPSLTSFVPTLPEPNEEIFWLGEFLHLIHSDATRLAGPSGSDRTSEHHVIPRYTGDAIVWHLREQSQRSGQYSIPLRLARGVWSYRTPSSSSLGRAPGRCVLLDRPILPLSL